MRASHANAGWIRTCAAIAAGVAVAAVIVFSLGGRPGAEPSPGIDLPYLTQAAYGAEPEPNRPPADSSQVVKARPAPEFVVKGIDWIIKAQHPDGGWGAGSHAGQQIRDPHAVKVDPATTAFVASALLRYGSTPVDGKHRESVRRATEYLCTTVEEYTKPGPKITDLEGTQIQAKLGPLVDTAMTAQYLARVLALVPKSDRLHGRIDKALDKCLAKLNESQQKDGSWNVGGGWASVLQSSLGCQALEYAQAAGKQVDADRLEKARKYQLDNYDAKTGRARTEAAAGVALYAFSGAMRGNAAQAKAAGDVIDRAKRDGKLSADAPVTFENLQIAGLKDKEARTLALANANVVGQSQFISGGRSYAGAADVSGPVATTAPIAASAVASVAEVAKVAEPGAVSRPVGGPAPVSAVPAAIARRTYAGESAVTTDEALLAGFGNNGGEEYLSYMLAAESMVILGPKDWNAWYDKMSGRLAKVQSPDGSWTGHHCITSPVFCTAAVVQTMTADHDAEMLARLAQEAAAIAKADVKK